MSEDTSGGVDPNIVRKTRLVNAPQEVAWRVFTEKMGTWWPLDHYTIGKAKAVDAIIEPRVGGRWYERGEDGSTCDWGSVLVWEPHSRLLLSWDITADWKYDPALKTEVEVRFIVEAPTRTRVELEASKDRALRSPSRRDARDFRQVGRLGSTAQRHLRASQRRNDEYPRGAPIAVRENSRR